MAKSKLPKKSHKALKAKGVRFRRAAKEIVIDKAAGLVFKSEEELFQFFEKHVDFLEHELAGFQAATLPPDAEKDALHLEETLEAPAEIWHDPKTFKEFPIYVFVRPLDDIEAFHVAVTYVSSEDEPTFIFLHFATQDLKLVEKYRRGDLIYDEAFEQVHFAALDGDALTEADPYAIGLFLAMLKLRSDKDIPYDKFKELGEECREETIENSDEIWRSSDTRGLALVTFIKAFSDHVVKDLFYVAVTQEDPKSQVHTLLFSFPTNDESLLERYRQGEDLHADEVSQENSH